MFNAIFVCKYTPFPFYKKIITLFFIKFFYFLAIVDYFCRLISKKYLFFDMKTLSDLLVNWYTSHCRLLPWRSTRDPYAVWLSEVILQQTRVAQGHDYYVRFLSEFPTVEALASADEDRVMRAWQGLGYYSRARNLHAAAKQVVARGGFPTTYDELRALKGVGDYTAAAIGSFAYGLPVAVVDGNVYRVLARLFGVDEPIDTVRGKRLFSALAEELLPVGDTATHNQAIMEFGALQCVPRHPDCAACPLADRCLALAQGRVEELPVKSHKTKVTERWFDYYYIHDEDCLYLHKRTGADIWHGLYELPLIEACGDGNAPASTTSATPSAAEDSVAVAVCLPLMERITITDVRQRSMRKHVLSHQVIHATLYEVWAEGPLPPVEGYIIIRKDDLDRYALPRLLTLLLEFRS